MLAAVAAPALATDLPLERVFSSPSLSGPTPRKAKLSPDGRFVTLLKNRADDKDRYDLWAIDTATGAQRMLVNSKKIGSGGAISEEEKMRRERARIAGTKGITEYGWAPDSRSILVPIDGDLYLATLDGKVRRLTETQATEIDPKVSETGRYLSFLRDQNLVRHGRGDRRRSTALTSDGGRTLSWGAAEFVAQEELDRDTGYWWSPDDRYIAVARVDESPVAVVKRAAIGASGTELIEQRYPAAGTRNAIVDLYRHDPGRQIAGESGPRRRTRIIISLASIGRRTARASTSSGSAATRSGSTCCGSIRRPAGRRSCSPKRRRPGSISPTISSR